MVANYKRLMGIDFGDVRIGIAFSDLLQIIASAHSTYKCKNEQEDLEYLANLIKENDVYKVVIGLPINMDGTYGERAEKTKNFGKKLALITPAEIDYQDERLSSVEAEEILIEAGVRREERKNLIDRVSAQIILQSYIDKGDKR